MTLRLFLRDLIAARCGPATSVRAFARAIDIPPTTLHSLITENASVRRVPRPADLRDLLDRLDTLAPLPEGTREKARRLLEEADGERRAAVEGVS